jgi:hypothetical protein
MPSISKEQIEAQIQHLRRYHIDNSASGLAALDAQIAMLQGLLDRPEGEPVAWRIEFEHGGRDHSTVHGHNAIGDYRDTYPDAKSIPLYRHPAPFTPITADMVTESVRNEFLSKDVLDEAIATAFNKYMGANK